MSELSLFTGGTANRVARNVECIAVPFRDGYIPAVLIDGKPHVILKPIVDLLGIAWAPQYTKLSAARWARVTLVVTQLPGDTQPRQWVVVAMSTFTIWLAGIQEGRVREEAQEAIIRYKEEAGDVLEEYFFGAATPYAAEIPKSFAEALELAAKQQRAIEARDAELAITRPKAGKWDAYINAEGLIGMTSIADILHTNVNSLTAWLVEENIFRKQVSQSGGRRNLPRKSYQDEGFFQVKTESNKGHAYPVAYATTRGVDLIVDRWEQRS